MNRLPFLSKFLDDVQPISSQMMSRGTDEDEEGTTSGEDDSSGEEGEE